MTRIPNFRPIIIYSRKSMNGRTWGNVWHFHVPAAPLVEDRVPYAVANISPALHLLERSLHADNVTMIDHYVGDTRENRPPGIPAESYFERVVYGDVGTGTTGNALEALAPLNTALLLKCTVASERSGFKFIKGRLLDTHVSPGGRSGVVPTSGALLGTLNGELAAAVVGSGMNGHLAGGAGVGDWQLATAHYFVDVPTKTRFVDHMSAVVSLGYVNVTARQVDRRRTKRTPKDQV